MRKLALLATLALALIACEKEQQQPEPLKTTFNVTKFSFNVYGSGYDVTTGPDVYFKFYRDGLFVGSTNYYENTTAGVINLNVGDMYLTLNKVHEIEIWDYDSGSDDDFITALTFIPKNNQTEYSAASSEAKITLTGNWQ